MDRRRRSGQQGQAIVLVALILVVLFGFLGLAMDGGRGYIDRRQLQSAVDAAALAAAYDYMNNTSYAQADAAATNVFASNERLYTPPSCSGGATATSCSFGDPTGMVLTITAVSHAVAGVSFTASARHSIPVTMMQVLGSGPTMSISASASAVARQHGTKGAAVQTLSPAGCGGAGGNSLSFSGTSTTKVSGDVWANGSITDSGQANGSVDGNVTDICPAMPPSPLPNFTVSGSQVNGWAMPDPGFAQPALNAASQTWTASSVVQQPGTYAADPKLNGSACYFLAGGVYTWQSGFTFNGGFVSNELRPPDEPQLSAAGTPNTTTTSAAIASGGISSIPVNSLPGAVPGSTTVFVDGQAFTVDNAGASAGATSIKLDKNQSATANIPSGSILTVRALPQFWDANGVNCAGSFTLSSPGSGSFSPGSYSVVVTALRWSPNGVSSCTGPSSPSCFERESAPSMCKTLTLGASGNLKVAVSGDPGAQDFNVYLATNGNCTGLTYCTDLGNGSLSVVINNNCATPPQPGPPDGEALPLGTGLPNADPPAGAPPHGDLANEGHCVDPSTGNAVACPGTMTPGAVIFDVPGGGSNSVCLNLQGGGDIYVFSGYQYNRILLFEPGAEQQPPANTCPNGVAGHGLTSLIGIFYMPAASITITGNSSFLATIAGGVICWTANVKGNGGVSISVDPSLRTWPATVRLTQ